MFTNEELSQFNNINSGAFDLMRVNARTTGEKIPLWLCMSESAKQVAREDFYVWCRKNFPNAQMLSNQAIQVLISNINCINQINNWMKLELTAKNIREAGGTDGYFV